MPVNALPSEQQTLRGQLAVITGGTDGIGKETALRLAALGAELILVGRNPEKGQQAVAQIQAAYPSSRIHYWSFDLSLMQSVNQLAQRIRTQVPRLDMLIHSAGVMLPKRRLTTEGLETVFAVQYLARFQLTNALLGHFGPQQRIVSVSAGGTIPLHLDFNNLNGERFYNGVFALIHESVANDLFGLRFIDQHPEICFYNYGPFYVQTGLFVDMAWPFKLATNTVGRFVATTTAAAAQDIVGLLTGDQPSGMYSRHLKPVKPSRYRIDKAVQSRLWAVSEQLVADALKHPEKAL